LASGQSGIYALQTSETKENSKNKICSNSPDHIFSLLYVEKRFKMAFVIAIVVIIG